MKIKHRAVEFLLSRYFALCIITIGLYLRLNHYFENRSLWVDEAWLAWGVSKQTFFEIFTMQTFSPDLPLPPAGFLLFEKLFTLLSNNEYMLRLFPLLSSIVGLFLFYLMLRKFVRPRVLPISLGLFALSDIIIYYSAEVKQYSSDLLIAIMIFLIAEYFKNRKIKKAAFTLAGIFALCLSHSAVFVLASAGLVLFLSRIRENNKEETRALLLAFVYWICFFAVIYKITLSRMLNSFYPIEWKVNVWSLEGAKWIWEDIISMFNAPIGIAPSYLWLVVLMIGGVSYYKNRKQKFFLLVLPFIFIFTAYLFRKHPFGYRFIMFCLPMFYILLGEGIVSVAEKIKKFKGIISLLLIVVLFYTPVKTAAKKVVEGREREEMRPLMRYFKFHHKKGDDIYVNTSAQFAYYYYLGNMKIKNTKKQIGRISDHLIHKKAGWVTSVRTQTGIYNKENWFLGLEDDEELEKLYPLAPNQWYKEEGNKRTWIIFTHYDPGLDEFVLSALDSQGKKLDEKKYKYAAIYLYDLSKKE